MGSQGWRGQPDLPPKNPSSQVLLQTPDEDPCPFMETWRRPACLPECKGHFPGALGLLSSQRRPQGLPGTPPSSLGPQTVHKLHPSSRGRFPNSRGLGLETQVASGSENQHASGLGADSLETQMTGKIQVVITVQSRKCGSRRGGLGGREVDSEE